MHIHLKFYDKGHAFEEMISINSKVLDTLLHGQDDSKYSTKPS
jgi:hypothetical protein